jgi:hypothetical protein
LRNGSGKEEEKQMHKNAAIQLERGPTSSSFNWLIVQALTTLGT